MITNFTKNSLLIIFLCWFSQAGFAKTGKEAGFSVSKKDRWSASTSFALNAGVVPDGAYANSKKAVTGIFAVDPPMASGGASCGTGPVTLTASGGTNGNYRWYTTATGGSAISNATDATYTTPVLTETTTFYVSVVSGNEESERTAVTATINAIPLTPEIPSDIYLCQGAAPVTVPDYGTFVQWYTTPTGGTALGSAPIINTNNVGTATYYVAFNVNGCESERARLTIVIFGFPANPLVTNTTICAGATASLTASGAPTGVSYRWYTTASAVEPISGATGSTYTTPVLTATTTYYVSTINGGDCESERQPIVVTVNPVIANNTISGAQTLCAGTTPAQITGSSPTGGNGNFMSLWEFSTDGITFAPAPGENNTLNYSPGALSADTWFRRTITTSCQSVSNVVKITVSPSPAIPTVNDITVCTGQNATVNVTSPVSGYTYRWYTTATAGSIIFTGTAYTTPNLNTNIMYYVEAVNGSGCMSSRDPVTVNVNPLPTAPVVTPSFTYCPGTTAPALTATGENLQWYTAATGGTAATTAPTPTTTTAGVTEYYVSQTVNGCESERAQITVTVTALPAVTLEAFATPVCNTITNFALTGAQPAGGTFSGPGVSDGVFNATTAGEGTHTITYTYTENGCSATATQTITVTTCTGLPDSKLAANLLLYPNPTDAKLQVILPLPTKTSLDLKLIDAKGQMVLEQHYGQLSGEFNRVLDLKDKAKGIYLLQFILEDGIITKRIVIN